jgi:hypothetical protein
MKKLSSVKQLFEQVFGGAGVARWTGESPRIGTTSTSVLVKVHRIRWTDLRTGVVEFDKWVVVIA